ncbi:MAG: FAD-dependent oxidoreductase [Acidobacteria bacterium]|nr:FAD-dependent oxidoreductase [Acidobacteriota bacterium]
MTRDIVLLGLGHTNAEIVRRWRRRPFRDARLVCVSDSASAAYSGMLPAVLAGQCPPERMRIDLARLCKAAGAELVVGCAIGLDVARRQLIMDGSAPVRFDVLSIGVGSVPTVAGVVVADARPYIPVKPMRTLLSRLIARFDRVVDSFRPQTVRVSIVGGGAGGVELALCIAPFIQATYPRLSDVGVTIVTADGDLLPGGLPRTRERLARILRARRVQVERNARVVRIDSEGVSLEDGRTLQSDAVIWATGAAPPPVLSTFGLPVDDAGFLRTRSTLQVVTGDPVFAVGDTGSIDGAVMPKAGVYAVRQGPLLWENLRRALDGRPLRPFVPQPGFLRLLNTGDGRALGDWRGWSFEGTWVRVWKDMIDRRFVARYQ